MKQRDEKKETRKLPMSRRGKRLMVIYAALVLMMTAGATTVFAADDPLTVINNLSEFIAGGVIITFAKEILTLIAG